MPQHDVVVLLNQQQTELLDMTVKQGHASDLQTLIKRALREFAAAHPPSQDLPETD
jgi:hypothetical protein